MFQSKPKNIEEFIRKDPKAFNAKRINKFKGVTMNEFSNPMNNV